MTDMAIVTLILFKFIIRNRNTSYLKMLTKHINYGIHEKVQNACGKTTLPSAT